MSIRLISPFQISIRTYLLQIFICFIIDKNNLYKYQDGRIILNDLRSLLKRDNTVQNITKMK